MNKIALLFDRSHIDTQHCFMELAIQLAGLGFGIDLYMINTSTNHLPFFEDQRIRVLPFPQSKFQKAEYWSKIIYSKDRKYKAIIATPVMGAWIAYQTARIQKIPYYYFTDELVDHLLADVEVNLKTKLERRNYISNKHAAATIALDEERYIVQKRVNKIDYPHDYIILPNAPAGDTVRLRSHYFRDIFNIEDRKPILLFAGTLNWNLAGKIYEETKAYSERDYYIVFQSRTVGLMSEQEHPFIKMSTIPIPSAMMNYAVSSADIGLALYDKNSAHETVNGIAGGKIGTYLKNELPLIAGSAQNLKIFENNNVGTYWDGEKPFDQVAKLAITNIKTHREQIPGFYRNHLQYDIFFDRLKSHLLKSIH